MFSEGKRENIFFLWLFVEREKRLLTKSINFILIMEVSG